MHVHTQSQLNIMQHNHKNAGLIILINVYRVAQNRKLVGKVIAIIINSILLSHPVHRLVFLLLLLLLLLLLHRGCGKNAAIPVTLPGQKSHFAAVLFCPGPGFRYYLELKRS